MPRKETAPSTSSSTAFTLVDHRGQRSDFGAARSVLLARGRARRRPVSAIPLTRAAEGILAVPEERGFDAAVLIIERPPKEPFAASSEDLPGELGLHAAESRQRLTGYRGPFERVGGPDRRGAGGGGRHAPLAALLGLQALHPPQGGRLGRRRRQRVQRDD